MNDMPTKVCRISRLMKLQQKELSKQKTQFAKREYTSTLKKKHMPSHFVHQQSSSDSFFGPIFWHKPCDVDRVSTCAVCGAVDRCVAVEGIL